MAEPSLRTGWYSRELPMSRRPLLPHLLGCLLLAAATAGAQDQPDTAQALFQQGFTALTEGRNAEAIALYERYLELRPENKIAAYNLGCGHSKLGNADEAFGWLARAIDWGYADRIHVGRDPDLDPLREDPRWDPLLDRLLESMRSRILERRAELERARASFDDTRFVWRDGQSGSLLSVRFSPDGRDVMTTGDDGRVVVWDAYSGEAIGYLGLYSSKLLRAEYDSTGRRVLVHEVATRQIDLWDPHTERRIDIPDLRDEFATDFDFAPDGSAFVVMDDKGRLRIFGPDGRARTTPPMSTGVPGVVRWSADGTRLLTNCEDRVAELFDASSGESLRVFGGDGEPAFARFTDDGGRVVVHYGFDWQGAAEVAGGIASMQYSLTHPGRVEVWDAAKPAGPLFVRETLVPPTFTSTYGSCVDGAGARLVTLEQSGSAYRFRVWDVNEGRLIHERAGARLRQTSIAVRPDGRRVSTVISDPGGGFDTVHQIFDPDSGETLRFNTNKQRFGGGSFDPQGTGFTQLFSPVLSGRVLVDGEKGSFVYAINQGASIYDYAFSPDGQRVVSVGYPSFGWIIGPEGPDERITLASHAMRARGVTLHPLPHPETGGAVVVCCATGNDGSTGAVRYWDLATGTAQEALPPLGWPVQGCSVGPDGSELIVHGGPARLLPAGDLGSSGERIMDWGAVVHAELGLGGSRAVGVQSGGNPAMVTLFARTGKPWEVLGRFPTFVWGGNAENPWAVFGQDGAVFAMVPKVGPGTPYGTVHVHDAETGALIEPLVPNRPISAVKHVFFSPDGHWLVACANRTRLWDAVSWEEQEERTEVFPNMVWHGAFSTDSRRYVMGCLDGTARIVTADGSRETLVLEGHTEGVMFVAFGPRDATVVTCSQDGTVRLWRAETGALLHELRGHTAGIRSAVFAGDDRLVTAGDDSSFRLWDTRSGRLLLTLVVYTDDEWIVFEPSGHYTGSERGADWARVRANGGLYPASSYARLLQSAQRVAAAARGEKVTAPALLDSAPDLDILDPVSDVQHARRFDLRARAKGLQEIVAIRVRQDDVELEGVELHSERSRRGEWTATVSLGLEIPVGPDETTIRLRAENAAGVLSWPETVRVTFEPPTADLYLVAIGVEDYADDTLDLSYPIDDVQAVVERFRREEGKLFDEVHVLQLEGPQVREGTLRVHRDEVLAFAGEEDMIVVFVAGHAVRVTERRDYYFLTRDVTRAEPQFGIPRDTLESLVMDDRIRARRCVLLMDTCHAGEEFRKDARGVSVGGSPLYKTAEVEEAQGSGLHIIAASTEAGSAIEKDGHGLFTYALLQALDGAADGAGGRPQDGKVDIDELKTYIAAQVYELSGHTQRPTTPSSRAGRPFALATVER